MRLNIRFWGIFFFMVPVAGVGGPSPQCQGDGAASQAASVAHRPGGFNATDIADVLEIERQVWAASSSGLEHLSNESRIFGEKTDHSRGHSVTYLQGHIGATQKGRAIMAKLKAVTLELEAQAGWGIASSGAFPTLAPRAVESIRYDNARDVGGDSATEIGWHSDFWSVMTVSVMLSPASAFSGGAFQTRRLGADSVVAHELDLGDVTVWKSWDRHRVEPLVGHRHVLVVQWWTAPAHTSKRTGPGRADYFTEGGELLLPYCRGISDRVDPTSYYAAQICGLDIQRLGRHSRSSEEEAGFYKQALRYHERAAHIAGGSSVELERGALLSVAQCLSRIHFARGVRPSREAVDGVVQACERVHELGEGGQQDLGGTVLRMLKQVIAVKALGLGSHAAFESKYPFLKLYWR
eukprot:g4052.t1